MPERIDHVQEERDIRLVSWGIRLGFAVVLGVPAFLLTRYALATWAPRADWFPVVLVLGYLAVGAVLMGALHRRFGGFPWWP